MKKIQSKMKALKWHFSYYKYMGIFSKRSREANSVVSDRFWPNFELAPDFMHVLVTCKYKNDQIKNNREKVATPFSPLKPYGNFILPWKLVSEIFMFKSVDTRTHEWIDRQTDAGSSPIL